MANRRHNGLIWATICVWGTALAAAGYCHLSLPEAALEPHYYALSLRGQRCGWAEQILQRTETGFVTTEQILLRVQLEGRTLTSTRKETRTYDEKWQLVAVEQYANQLGRPVHVRVQRENNQLLMTRQAPDGETRRQWTLPDNFGQELFLLRAILEKKLKPGWTLSFTTFDSDLGMLDEITVTALEHIAEPEAAWLVQAQSQKLGIQTRTWISEQGVILRQEVPTMLGLKMELVRREEALAELQPFLLETAIPVERDLGPPEKLRQLQLLIQSASAPAQALFATTARQRLRLTEQGALLTVEAGQPPRQSRRLPLSEPEWQPFLQPSDMAPSDHPRLRQQAQQIIGEETKAWAAAQKLLQWTYRTLAKVPSEPRPLTALEVLQEKKGDCTEHSVLLAALAQAVGLPARIVVGLVYSQRAFHYHAWNEIYVGEWIEMDATWGQELVDAGHIQTASGALDSASIARLSLSASQMMGTLQLKILDFQAAP